MNERGLMMNVTLLTNEISPYHVQGGLGVAISRLVDQLRSLHVNCCVLFPSSEIDTPEPWSVAGITLIPIRVVSGNSLQSKAELWVEFCRNAIRAGEKLGVLDNSSFIINDNEAAVALALLRDIEVQAAQQVFWMHSLYDYPLSAQFSGRVRSHLSEYSLMASAMSLADVVVLSSGVLDDATNCRWPARLISIQMAIQAAHHANRILLVESTGCLPESSGKTVELQSTVTTTFGRADCPYVLFPSRPSVARGISIFEAVAQRLNHLDVNFVAVGEPDAKTKNRCQSIQWIPWQSQSQLYALMRGARCVVLPSITEQFGLSAVESASQGAITLYQDVGGLRALGLYENAYKIPMSKIELENLYEFWGGLLDHLSDMWQVWDEFQVRFHGLVNSWVQHIEMAVLTNTFHTHHDSDELLIVPRNIRGSRWGDALVDFLKEQGCC